MQITESICCSSFACLRVAHSQTLRVPGSTASEVSSANMCYRLSLQTPTILQRPINILPTTSSVNTATPTACNAAQPTFFEYTTKTTYHAGEHFLLPPLLLLLLLSLLSFHLLGPLSNLMTPRAPLGCNSSSLGLNSSLSPSLSDPVGMTAAAPGPSDAVAAAVAAAVAGVKVQAGFLERVAWSNRHGSNTCKDPSKKDVIHLDWPIHWTL